MASNATDSGAAGRAGVCRNLTDSRRAGGIVNPGSGSIRDEAERARRVKIYAAQWAATGTIRYLTRPADADPTGNVRPYGGLAGVSVARQIARELAAGGATKRERAALAELLPAELLAGPGRGACRVPGCTAAAHCRGLCSTHYSSARAGHPAHAPYILPPNQRGRRGGRPPGAHHVQPE